MVSINTINEYKILKSTENVNSYNIYNKSCMKIPILYINPPIYIITTHTFYEL